MPTGAFGSSCQPRSVARLATAAALFGAGSAGKEK